MKTVLGILLCCISILACKKNSVDTGGNNPPPPPPAPIDTNNIIPAATPVTTGVLFYADNVQWTDPYSGMYGNTYLAHNGFGFSSTGNITGEKYYTTLLATPQLTFSIGELMGLTPSRIITLSSTVKNYAQVKLPRLTGIGNTLYDYGTATFAMPGGGSIYIPPYAYTPTLGGSVTFNVKVDHQTPFITDYALTMPTLSGDINNKRYFLDSYGCYVIMLGASDNSGHSIDFKSTAPVLLKMPIPSNLQAAAPDSIECWNFSQGYQWIKNGYAKKNGNFYDRIINKKGYWNFALPVDGTYATLKFRSQSDGLPVMNMRYRIKNGAAEVAQGRTDADGNALIFVPKNRSLDVEFRNDHFYSWEYMAPYSTTMNIGTFSSNTERTVTVADRNDLAVLEGNVYNCDGTVFNSGGYALISAANPPIAGKDNYRAAITNGKFKMTHWMPHVAYNNPYYLDIYDNNNVQVSRTNIALCFEDAPPGDLSYFASGNINFYNCPNADKVYSNFKLDNTATSITGNASDPSPKVTCDYTRVAVTGDIVKINNNGTLISFVGSLSMGYNGLHQQGLIVNGVNCTVDQNNGISRIIMTRVDANAGGIVEGWFSIRYRDPSNVYHTLKGNFRAKRIG